MGNYKIFSRNYEIFSRNYELIRDEFNFKYDTYRLSYLYDLYDCNILAIFGSTFFDWARVFFFSFCTCFDGRHQLLIFPKSLISVHIPFSKSPSNRIKKYKSHLTVRAYVHFDQIFVPWRTNNFSWKKVQRFNLKWNCRLPYIILWLVMFFLWRL